MNVGERVRVNGHKADGTCYRSRFATVEAIEKDRMETKDTEISFTDHELDVSRIPPERARIVDEDEFLEAAARYGYSSELQWICYEVAREAAESSQRVGDRGHARYGVSRRSRG